MVLQKPVIYNFQEECANYMFLASVNQGQISKGDHERSGDQTVIRYVFDDADFVKKFISLKLSAEHEQIMSGIFMNLSFKTRTL